MQGGTIMRFINKIFEIIKREILELQFLFVNYLVSNIPIWIIRKFLYICCGLKIGKKSRIMMKAKIYSPHKVKIGNRTVINEFCYIDGRGGIIIGDDVTIATYAKLITGSHDIDSRDFCYQSKPIIIENNSAVFSDSLVLGGAVLHEGCVISAKSLVRAGDYENNGIFAGNPAKFIRYRKCEARYEQEPIALIFR